MLHYLLQVRYETVCYAAGGRTSGGTDYGALAGRLFGR